MNRTSDKRGQERGRASRGLARTPPRDGLTLNEHGTRVRFVAKCTSCGVEKELAKAPRGKFVCAACGGRETVVPTDAELAYHCAGCSRPGWASASVLAKGPLLCSDCMSGLQQPVHGRAEGSKVLDSEGGVRKKRQSSHTA